jgi:hypothetical protein
MDDSLDMSLYRQASNYLQPDIIPRVRQILSSLSQTKPPTEAQFAS